MGRFQCPSCGTVVEGDDPSTLVCPSCGYGSTGAGGGRPQPSQPSRPPQKPQQPQQPTYGVGTSPTYQPSTAPGGAPYGTTPYPSAQYGSAGHPGYGMQKKSPGMAVAALILGIAGLCLALIFPPLGIVPGILGLIFGFLGIKQVNENPQTAGGKGMAVAGVVLGILAVVWGIIGLIFLSVFLEEFERALQETVSLMGQG